MSKNYARWLRFQFTPYSGDIFVYCAILHNRKLSIICFLMLHEHSGFVKIHVTASSHSPRLIISSMAGVDPATAIISQLGCAWTKIIKKAARGKSVQKNKHLIFS
jgi:hypothetical protein